MVDLTFADVKVHNEIEFCAVNDLQVKKQLERLMLENHISYCERWEDTSFLKRMLYGESKYKCILCINSMQKEKAEEILDEHPEIRGGVQLLGRRVEKTYFS